MGQTETKCVHTHLHKFKIGSDLVNAKHQFKTNLKKHNVVGNDLVDD